MSFVGGERRPITKDVKHGRVKKRFIGVAYNNNNNNSYAVRRKRATSGLPGRPATGSPILSLGGREWWKIYLR